MKTWTIQIRKKGLQPATVERLVRYFKDEVGADAVSVSSHEPAESRADRLNEAMSSLETAKSDAVSEVEELRDEIQSWLDNLEGASMENVPKHDEVQECLDALEELLSTLEDIEVPDSGDVSFPGMY